MYHQISSINRSMVFIQKFIYLSLTRVWEREKVSNQEIMGNNQLQQNECQQVITFDDSFM
jgi:hypothetical protein